MSRRGARGGANRSEGMAAREASPACGSLFDSRHPGCFRPRGHRGFHMARVGPYYVEWRFLEAGQVAGARRLIQVPGISNETGEQK